jgi:hypothetical protein
MDIQIDMPANLHCRGRNGWFFGDRAVVYSTQTDGQLNVGIKSSRPFLDVPPIFISGPASEVRSFLQELLDAADKAIAMENLASAGA